MKLGIIAASMLIGAASLVSAHAQTSSEAMVVPKNAIPNAARVSQDKKAPTVLRVTSEPTTSTTNAPMAARVDPGK
jgi:hypothetical protein